MASRAAPAIQRQNGKTTKTSKASSAVRTEPAVPGSTHDVALGSAADTEVVGLSLTPFLRERLEKSLACIPDVDSGRVDEIRAALENGTLQIDAEKIAEAIIRFERSLDC